METYLGQPIFIWEALANFASILLAGLIIAFVTTFYLKKKDERTRVAGVILEKRVEAQQEILQFVESNTQKLEMQQPVFVKQVVRFLMQLIRHFSLTRYSPSMGLARPL